MFNSYSIDKASLDRVANNLESMRLSMLSPGPRDLNAMRGDLRLLVETMQTLRSVVDNLNNHVQGPKT